MTIDEAIKVLQDNQGRGTLFWTVRYINAYKLGIEALKALPAYRNKLKHPEKWLLPGETKE